ncbi:MAG: hypothetical protein ACLTZM_10190 [Ruminococcus sp.]
MMRHKIEMTADEKSWNRISQILAVVLVLLSGIDIVGLQFWEIRQHLLHSV